MRRVPADDGVVAGVIAGALLMVLIIMIIMVWYRRRLKKRYALFLEPDDHFQVSGELHEKCLTKLTFPMTIDSSYK